jgi:predicted double-glycine peptidase
MKKPRRSRHFAKEDRGSALLVSLMVIVGLSLLGLGFVTLSETETAIAKNEQAALETQAVAEAGAKLVVEWFQNPAWGLSTAGMPSNDPTVNPNINAIKTTRLYQGSTPNTGVYKPLATTMLFDKPYRPNNDDRFFADENTGDIVINRTTDPTTINNINTILFGPTPDDRRNGEITEIRVYAPPMTNANLVQNGTATNPDGTPQMFYEGAVQRFGVATIKATAQLFRDASLPDPQRTAPANVVATHSVRLVVGEIPIPIPGGPIQSNTAISFGGDFVVHWGNETAAINPNNPASTGDLTNKRNPPSLPWANAYERTHFEHGLENVYDPVAVPGLPGPGVASILITNGGSGYLAAPVVTVDAPCTFNGTTCVANTGVQAIATATITNGVVTAITLDGVGNTHGSGYATIPPGLGVKDLQGNVINWGPTVTIAAPPAGGTQATAIASVGGDVWPIPFTTYDSADYLHEILGKTFEDPWFGSRAAGKNNLCGSPSDLQCLQYDLVNDTTDELASGIGTPQTYSFQTQNVNSYPLKKLVTFPVIVYDFWKKVASQGRGYKGIYYFKYDKNTGNFLLNGAGTPKPMSYWANGLPMQGGKGGSGLGAGVFFFDTVDGTNPQNCNCTAANNPELTPAENWKASDFNQAFLMTGFIYINAKAWGTAGAGSAATNLNVNMPGEPYRDIGYPRWDSTHNVWDGLPGSNDALGSKLCGGQICRDGVSNGKWDCQTSMSNNTVNGVKRCDIVTIQAPAWYSYDPAATKHNAGSIYVEKVWKSVNEAIRDYGAACTAPLAGYNGTARSSDCSLPHEPYLNIIFPDSSSGSASTTPVQVGWESGYGTHQPTQTDTNNNIIPCPSSWTPDKCTSNGYDVDGGVVQLTVTLDGVLYNEGDYNSTGNDAFFGSLLINGNVTGTGTPDVWFDEKLIKGTWAPPNMPRVIVYNEQTDETQPQQ